MSELKAKHVVDVYDEYSSDPYKEAQVYLKSEADKVIADLEESHKKEVGQLLIEIAELKKEKEYAIEHTAEVINGQERELRHHKYKRCLAMADKCESMCYWFAARFDHHELVDNVKWELFDRWRLRWAKLADKFKEEVK